MKTFLKIFAVVIVIIVALLIAIPLILKGKLADIVKAEANKMLNARLDFEELDISLLRNFPQATLVLKNLSLIGTGEFEGDTLAAADEVAAAVNLMSLFGDTGYEITYVTLERPTVHAIVHSGGAVNWDILKTDNTATEESAGETSESSAFDLQLRKFRITDACLSYTDEASNTTFSTGKLNLALTGKLSGLKTALQCKALIQNIDMSMEGVSYLHNAELEADMKLIADLNNYTFTLDENRLRLNAIETTLDGWVAMPDTSIDMDIRLSTPKINFKDILSMIPAIYQNNFADLQTSGNVSLTAEAKGRLDANTLPAFTVALDVDKARLFYTGMPRSVDDINIALRVANNGGDLDQTTIDVNTFRFTFAGNPFALTLHASHPMSDLQFGASAKGAIDLGKIEEIYPLGDSIALSGVITTDITLNGRMSDIEKKNYQNIQGEGNLSISEMNLSLTGLPPIVIAQADTRITPEAMNLTRFDLTVGRSDLQATGKISNYLPYVMAGGTLQGNLSLSSSQLDLNELLTTEDTPESNAAADSTATDTTSLSVFIVPEDLDLSMQARVKKIIFDNMTLGNFTGKVSVKNGTASLDGISVDALGGNISANGSYSTASSTTSPRVSLSLGIKEASFKETFEQLDFVQQLVPLFAKTGGNYSISANLDTRLDSQMSPILNSLTAKGSLQSKNIEIQNLEVFNLLANLLKNDKLRKVEAKDINIRFAITDGRVQTSPFDLKIGNTKLTLSGSTGLDQTIDYTALIDLSKEKVISDYVGIVEARIGGTFAKPTIDIDTESLVKQAVTNKVVEAIAGKGTTEEQVANIRQKAEEAGRLLVETAEREGEKLVEKASNPLAKIAAKAAKTKMVEEAQKQAARLADEAEAQIRKLKGE